MIRMFVRHPVTDFAAWKQAYDDFDDERIGMGVAGDAVFQSASVLFQKYLVHNAMDGYMGVHGYDNQEVAAATG